MSQPELERAREVLADVRQQIAKAAEGDERLAFAVNRYVYKNLIYAERGTPAQRNKLKSAKLRAQQGKCAHAECPFPDRQLRKEDEPN
jgi:DNA-directed RNA polymerase subunit M/transcription elongation factor TFIIS